MATTPRDEPLMNAISIWDRVKQSGLAPTTYDSDFSTAFSRALRLRADKSIESELRRLDPAVSDVLAAFVSCCEPFDGMAQDVWNMFVYADARFSDENLQIAFDFSKKQPNGFKFNLEHFRAFHNELVRFRELVAKHPLTQNFLWGLERCTRSEDPGTTSADVRHWAEAYDRGEWITPVPAVSTTGDARTDLCLREVRNVVVAVVEQLVSNGVRPHEGVYGLQDRTGAQLDARPSDDPLLSAIRADHDRWTGTMVNRLDQLAARIVASGRDEQALAMVRSAEEYLGKHRHIVEQDAIADILREFLNLPLWNSGTSYLGFGRRRKSRRLSATTNLSSTRSRAAYASVSQAPILPQSAANPAFTYTRNFALARPCCSARGASAAFSPIGVLSENRQRMKVLRL